MKAYCMMKKIQKQHPQKKHFIELSEAYIYLIKIGSIQKKYALQKIV